MTTTCVLWETTQGSGNVLGGGALETVNELCNTIFNLNQEGHIRNNLIMTWAKMKV